MSSSVLDIDAIAARLMANIIAEYPNYTIEERYAKLYKDLAPILKVKANMERDEKASLSSLQKPKPVAAAQPKKPPVIKKRGPCKYGAACKREDCYFDHPPPIVAETDKFKKLCTKGRLCEHKNCMFLHPERKKINKPCNYGISCKNMNCLYMH